MVFIYEQWKYGGNSPFQYGVCWHQSEHSFHAHKLVGLFYVNAAYKSLCIYPSFFWKNTIHCSGDVGYTNF